MATDTIALCTPHNAFRTDDDPPDFAVKYDTNTPVPVLAYDDATDQTEYWLCWMPEDYGAGGLTCEVIWSFAGTSTNNFGAEIGIARLQADTTDLDAANFAANNTASFAHNGTNGGVNQDTITFTNGADMDSVAAGEPFFIRLMRDTSVSSDLVGDVDVLGMVVRET